MASIEVVENPGRRRRRHYTAKQRAYGFGGRRTRRRYRRRRNEPLLAALANPRRRRSRRRSPYSVSHVIHRRGRRRNPDFLKGFDFMAGVWVGVGAIGSTVIPGLLRRFIPQIPYTGPITYAVRLGGTAATAFAVKLLVKNQRASNLIWAGGIGLILVDLYREYLAPRLGLSGLGLEDQYVLTSELQDALSGVDGYRSLSGYRQAVYNPALAA